MSEGRHLAPRAKPILGNRELEVVKQLHNSNYRIAENFEISYHTVEKHVENIFWKLEVTSRTEAVVKALRLGLITVSDFNDNKQIRVKSTLVQPSTTRKKRLNQQQVDEIRSRKGENTLALAVEFNVSRNLIQKILAGKSHKPLTLTKSSVSSGRCGYFIDTKQTKWDLE